MNPSASDRWLAIASNLGVPLYGPVLPFVMYLICADRPFVRLHASRAFSFQLIVIAFWIPLVIAMATGALSPVVLVLVLLMALILELPNVSLAFLGRPPIRFPPFIVLGRTRQH